MRRPPVVIALAILAALTIVATIHWMQGQPPPADAEISALPASILASDANVAGAAEDAAADPARDAVARPAEAAAQDGPPASYRAALGVVKGRVVDQDGAPKPDLAIELIGGNLSDLLPTREDVFGDAAPAPRLIGGKTTTDTAGRFTFEDVDPRGFFVFAIERGKPRAMLWPLVAMPNPGETVDVGDIRLEPFAVLTGRVTDERGGPIAGARVRAAEGLLEAQRYGLTRLRRGCAVAGKIPDSLAGVVPGMTAGWQVVRIPDWIFDALELLPLPTTQTGADGRFRLEGVALGTVGVVADVADRIEAVRGPISTTGGGERDVGTLALEPGEVLPVLVVDGADEPVEGADVFVGEVFPLYPVALLVPAGRTGADGRASMGGLRDGRHVAAARGPDATGFVLAEDVYAGVDEPVLRLDPAYALTVCARGADGAVIVHPQVAVARKDLLSQVPLCQIPVPLAGRRRALEDGRVRIEGLSSGTYDVFVTAQGRAVSRAEARIDERAASVDVTLEPERALEVHVVSADAREPVEYALVSAARPDRDGGGPAGPDTASAPPERSFDPFEFLPLVTRRTDAAGAARLPRLEEGMQRIRVFHPAYALAEQDVRVPGPPLVVELRAGGTLAGRVTRGGAIVGEPFAVLIGSGKDNDGLPRLGMSDANGDFRVTHVDAGAHAVTVVPASMLSRLGGEGSGGGMRIESRQGDQGRVSGGEADPESGVQVGTTIRIGGGDADPPAESPSGAFGFVESAEADVVVREGEETYVTLDTRMLDGPGAKANLSGLVRLNGAPAAGMGVEARRADGSGKSRAATTGADGRFDLGQVPAGDLVVGVRGASGSGLTGTVATRSVTLAENEARVLEFSVDTGSVSGRVVDAASGAPLAFATVVMLGTENGASLREATGEDGTFAFATAPQGGYLVRVECARYAATTVGPIHVPARGPAEPLRVDLTKSVTVSGTVQVPDGAGPAPFLFLHFRRRADAGPRITDQTALGSLAFVRPDTSTFEVEDVAPGSYDVDVMGTEHALAPVTLQVPLTGLQAVVLRPELAK